MSSKRPNSTLSNNDNYDLNYDELNALLSDSSDWDDLVMSPNKNNKKLCTDQVEVRSRPIVGANNVANRYSIPYAGDKLIPDNVRTLSGLSDIDDSSIIELLHEENLEIQKQKPPMFVPLKALVPKPELEDLSTMAESTQKNQKSQKHNGNLLGLSLSAEELNFTPDSFSNDKHDKIMTHNNDKALKIEQNDKENISPKEDILVSSTEGTDKHTDPILQKIDTNVKLPEPTVKNEAAPGITIGTKLDVDNTSLQILEILGKKDATEVSEEEVKMATAQLGEKFRFLTQRAIFTDVDKKQSRIAIPDRKKVKIPIILSKEQETVIDLAEKGHNIFYTGSAGTGKSVLLREMIKVLKKQYGPEKVAVTASTGLAACNIGGITVHSFAGIGLGNGDVTKLYRKVRRSKKNMKRWSEIKVLVVDEISMLDGELFDKLDYIAQKIRKNSSPFGGIQIILCGDFFQLPPVTKDSNASMKFAFQSEAWRKSIHVTIMLEKVFRQQGDTKFIDMLNQMRLGRIDAETEREFKKLNRPLPDDDIIPAELYSTRVEVDRANRSRLNRLPGQLFNYNAIDGGLLEDQEMKDRLLQNFLAPKQLQLKIGAQVMMIKNIDAQLVNGSLGKVIAFMDPETYLFYSTILTDSNITPDVMEGLKDKPESLKELYGGDEDDDNQRISKKKESFFNGNANGVPQDDLDDSLFDFMSEIEASSEEAKQNIERKKNIIKDLYKNADSKKRLPLVTFKTADMTTRTVLVEPEDWAIEDENEKPLVSRVQLPLMLAWSLSIHKSQGQTLPKVKVDLQRVFEKGQAYVALSRAVSREGLQVLNFDRSRIKAHDTVVNFYMTLVSADQAIEDLKMRNGGSLETKKTAPVYVATRSKSDTARRSPSTNGIAEMLRRKSCKTPE